MRAIRGCACCVKEGDFDPILLDMQRLIPVVYLFWTLWQADRALSTWEVGSSSQSDHTASQGIINSGFARARISFPSTVEHEIDLSMPWESIHRMVSGSAEAIAGYQTHHIGQTYPLTSSGEVSFGDKQFAPPVVFGYPPGLDRTPVVHIQTPEIYSSLQKHGATPTWQQAAEWSSAHGPKRLLPGSTDEGIYEGLDDLPNTMEPIRDTDRTVAGLDAHFPPSTPQTPSLHPIAALAPSFAPSTPHKPPRPFNTASLPVEGEEPHFYVGQTAQSTHPAIAFDPMQHEAVGPGHFPSPPQLPRGTEAAQLWKTWLVLGGPTRPDPRLYIHDSEKLDAAQTSALLKTFVESLRKLRSHLAKKNELVVSDPPMFRDWILRSAFRHIERKIQTYQRYNSWAQVHETFLTRLAPKRADLEQGKPVIYLAHESLQHRVAQNLLTWYAEDFNKFLSLISNAWFRHHLAS